MSNTNDARYARSQGGVPSTEGATAPAQPTLGQSLPLAPLNRGEDAATHGSVVYPAPAYPAPAYPAPAYPAPTHPVPTHAAPTLGYPGAQPTPGGAPVTPGSGVAHSPGVIGRCPGAPTPGYPPYAAGQTAATPAGYPATPPGYAAAPPGYAATPPGYPVSPYGYAAAYPFGIPSGRKFWALLFLCYIPYVGCFVTLIVSLVQWSKTRQSPFPIVRENARWAANWAFSYTLYMAVGALIIVIIVITTGFSYGDSYGTDRYQRAGWISIPVFVLIAIGIYCLVTMIRGCVVADRVVHRPALTIPFFRDWAARHSNHATATKAAAQHRRRGRVTPGHFCPWG
ncbi:MAG: DUF4870 domain-containing protein [Microbacterium sp.]